MSSEGFLTYSFKDIPISGTAKQLLAVQGLSRYPDHSALQIKKRLTNKKEKKEQKELQRTKDKKNNICTKLFLVF